MQPVKKINIINFAKVLEEDKSEEVTFSIVEKTTSAISELNMSKNPFNIVMLMNIYENDNEFTVINEANVVERFMELLLEKVNINESNISTFDFKNKEDFLISIAKYMHEKDKYIISKYEFDNLINDFFQPFGLDATISKFDTLFFKKHILVLNNNEVSFNHQFMLEYYIAKSFLKYGLPQTIFENYNYLRYINELNYYSGISRETTKIFRQIQSDLESIIDKYKEDMKYTDNYQIKLPIKFVTPNKSLTINEKSELTDKPDTSQKYNPNYYRKQNSSNKEETIAEFPKENFLSMLGIYARLIRNMDYLLVDTKIKAITNCIISCCIILNEFFKYFRDLITSIQEETKKEMNSDDYNDFNNFLTKIISMLQMSMPIAIENFLFQHLGNRKLTLIFKDIKAHNQFNVMEYFFFSSLYLDLKAPQSYEIIKDFIKNTKDDSILKLIYSKLMTIYMLTTSDYEEQNACNLLADLQTKQTHYTNKYSYLINEKNVIINELQNKKKEYLDSNN